MSDKKDEKKEKPTRISPAHRKAAMRIYLATLEMLRESVKTGVSNAPQGILTTALLVDILHGGAYAAPINELPYFRKDRTRSPYWAGYIQHTTPTGLGTIVGSGLFSGVSTADIWQEITVDANVPHVMPKVISDVAYAIFMTQFMQFTGTAIFQSAAGGLKTLVEATNGGEGVRRRLIKLAGVAAGATQTALGA